MYIITSQWLKSKQGGAGRNERKRQPSSMCVFGNRNFKKTPTNPSLHSPIPRHTRYDFHMVESSLDTVKSFIGIYVMDYHLHLSLFTSMAIHKCKPATRKCKNEPVEKVITWDVLQRTERRKTTITWEVQQTTEGRKTTISQEVQ